MSTTRIMETISGSTDIETKQLVSELSEYLSPEKQEQLHLPSYDNYAFDLRKSPNEALYLNYLRELKQLIMERETSILELNVTASQNKMIMGRKIWSDIVSETDLISYSKKHANKKQGINRIKDLGYNDAEQIYEKCLDCLQNNTTIVITFLACYMHLESGLKDFQRLNIFECSTKGDDYLKNRHQTEIDFFHYLSEDLKKSFVNNIHARPRYGTLQLLDPDHPPSRAQGGYGRSFIVLKECAKFSSLFAASDTLSLNHGRPWTMCTLQHLESLLLECNDKKLQAIIARAITGSFSKFDGYFEAQMPGFNLLNPDIVSHIHVDKYEYELPQESIDEIKKIGIGITNDYGDIYENEWKKNHRVIQSCDKENFQNNLSNKQGIHH
ncbi:MAG: hypothetical protein KIT56_10650 [Gammaproteobacteria bacterium]|nr:hypothetical protein [Gammaproteobacteria bacterium]MCW5584306.1 hypothetical protein [Gammaproteobacteria bacterium]